MLLVPRHQAGVEVRTIRNIAGGTEFCEIFFDGARTPGRHRRRGGRRRLEGRDGHARQRAGRRDRAALPGHVPSGRCATCSAWPSRQGPSTGPGPPPAAGGGVGRPADHGAQQRPAARSPCSGATTPGRSPRSASCTGRTGTADFGELMVDVLGADALVARTDGPLHPMVRSFLNARAETIYGGANEIQRNILGERVLGLPKEPHEPEEDDHEDRCDPAQGRETEAAPPPSSRGLRRSVGRVRPQHDPFLQLLQAAERPSGSTIGTAVAIAFARTPMTLANAAFDLALYAEGRFVLGLGSQVKPHIERRFSMPWSHPAAADAGVRCWRFVRSGPRWQDGREARLQGRLLHPHPHDPVLLPGRPRLRAPRRCTSPASASR